MNGSAHYWWLQLSRGVTCPQAQYYFCQLSEFDRSQIVNGHAALAQLASDLGSGRQATGRLTAIPIAGCVIDRAVSLKKP